MSGLMVTEWGSWNSNPNLSDSSLGLNAELPFPAHRTAGDLMRPWTRTPLVFCFSPHPVASMPVWLASL